MSLQHKLCSIAQDTTLYLINLMSRGGIQESSVLNLIYTCITGWVFEDVYDLSQSHLEDRILSTVTVVLCFGFHMLPAGCFCMGCSTSAVTPPILSSTISASTPMYFPPGKILASHHSTSGTISSWASFGVISASLVADEMPVFFAAAAISF